jgi:hypothetical protein
MKIEHCAQGTQDWFDARNGRVTASRIKDVTAYLKQTKAEVEAGIRREAQKRIDYRTEIIAETLLGEALPHFVSDAMKWGIEQEALAATEYEIESPEDVSGVGFVYHPSIERAGASPDRLVGKDGLLEVKCPNTTTHIEWILAGVVPEEHRPQMYFQIQCCERQWCDFLSFDSRLPKRYQKFIRRLHADEAIQESIDAEVLKFLAEVDATVAALDKQMPALAQEETPDPDAGLGLLTKEDFAGLL